MKTLLIISTLAIVSYIVLVVCLFKIPSSLSITYYLLKQKFGGDVKYLFTLMCAVCSFTLMPYWLEVSPENIKFLSFFAPIGLLFVGGAAAYFDNVTKIVHYVSAGICGVATLVWLCLVGLWFIPVITLAVGIIASLIDKKNFVWWIEMALFVACYIGLWIY